MALSDHLRAKDWTFSATSRAAQRRNEIALNILLASLAMFFAAALIGYLLIRFRSGRVLSEVRIPPVLWLSTVLALASSESLRRALRSVRRERQDLFRPQLLFAFLCGAGFCLSQSAGMATVFREFRAAQPARPAASADKRQEISLSLRRGGARPEAAVSPGLSAVDAESTDVETKRHLGGLFFVLILLHALHFTAGMIALAIVTRRGLSGRYDHEYHAGVKLCARYWRFLDVVWLTLFGTFLATTFDWGRLANGLAL